MQCACAILSSVACPGLQYFSTLSHKLYDIRKKKNVSDYKRCVLIFSTIFAWNISYSKELSDIWSKMYIGLHVKCPLFLSDLRKNSQISNFTKIRPVGAKFLHEETKSRFSQFCVAPSEYKFYIFSCVLIQLILISEIPLTDLSGC